MAMRTSLTWLRREKYVRNWLLSQRLINEIWRCSHVSSTKTTLFTHSPPGRRCPAMSFVGKATVRSMSQTCQLTGMQQLQKRCIISRAQECELVTLVNFVSWQVTAMSACLTCKHWKRLQIKESHIICRLQMLFSEMKRERWLHQVSTINTVSFHRSRCQCFSWWRYCSISASYWLFFYTLLSILFEAEKLSEYILQIYSISLSFSLFKKSF